MINRKHSQTAIDQRLAQTLERTKQRFVADLNHKIPEIEAIQILIQNEAERQNALTRLTFITHRFNGIAATLGLQSIGDCAAEIEQQISSLVHTPTQLSLLSGRIETLLDLMEDAIVKSL